jgi:Family of unknown function (DUF6011)
VPDVLLPWEGEWVRVERDRSWSFVRCCVCGRPLQGTKSREAGVGPECRRGYSEAGLRILRAHALKQDRMRWKLDRWQPPWRRKVVSRDRNRPAG